MIDRIVAMGGREVRSRAAAAMAAAKRKCPGIESSRREGVGWRMML